MKREVNFCSDHLSDLIFSKRLVRNQITYGFRRNPRWHLIHFTIPLKINTEKYLSLLNKGHNNSCNLATKIIHSRKNLPRQLNHRKSSVIIRGFDHPIKRKKKVDVNGITKHGVPLLFRTPEALKSLNNRAFTRKIELNDLHFSVPRVLFPRFLTGQYS